MILEKKTTIKVTLQSESTHSKDTEFAFIFLPSLSLLQKWRTERAQEDTTVSQRSPLPSSPRPLRSSKHSFDTHSFISLSLSHSKKLFKIYPDN